MRRKPSGAADSLLTFYAQTDVYAGRDIYHSIPYGKLEFTKVRNLPSRSGPATHALSVQSLLRSVKKPGWYIPGAHFLRNDDLPKEKARIITADGQPIKPIDLRPGTANPGTLYKGHNPFRVFEPLVMYHYVERGASLPSRSRSLARTDLHRPADLDVSSTLHFCAL